MEEEDSLESVQEDCSLLRRWLHIAAVDEAEVRAMARRKLSEYVDEVFDPAALDEATEGTEPWIEAMLADARWRQLIYEQLSKHPASILLRAVVQAVVARKTHASEVAEHPQLCSLIGGSSSLSTFISSLVTQLRSKRHGAPAAQATLDGVARAGELQLFCSQMLMQAAACGDSGGVGDGGATSAALLDAARSEMAESAAASHGVASRRLQLLACGVPRGSPLLSTLVSILSAGACSHSDALKLEQLCGQQAADASPASHVSSGLLEPAVLALLLGSLFDPSAPPKPAVRPALLATLAHAAAADEAEGAAGDAEARRASKSARQAAALASLRAAQRVCEADEVSTAGVTSSFAELQEHVHEPAVACGVLLWMRCNLTDQRRSAARYTSSYLPAALRVVGSIARAHASLHGAAVSLLHSLLTHEMPDDSDSNALTTVALRRLVLDCMLYMLTLGAVLPTLHTMHRWIDTADLSLTRHLLDKLVALADPPYSPAFARQLLQMIGHPKTVEAFAERSDAAAPLRAFASRVGASIPLLQSLALEVTEALEGAGGGGPDP